MRNWLDFVKKYQRQEEYEFDKGHIVLRTKLTHKIEASVEETVQFESLDFYRIGIDFCNGDDRNYRAIGRHVAKGRLLFFNYKSETRYIPKP